MMKKIILIITIMATAVSIYAGGLTEDEKINLLIESVKKTPVGTKFIRNGGEYDAEDAAGHLSGKYSRTKSKIKTAENFIEHLASSSSFSGKEYLLKFPDNTTITAKEFFTGELNKLNKK